MKQSKDYCKMWDSIFAYASNGHKIEEFDFTTMKQRTISLFPTPDELYQRYVIGRFGKLKQDPISEPFHRGEFTLRYYQEAAIKKILEAFLTTDARLKIFKKMLNDAIYKHWDEDIFYENCPPEDYDYEANGEVEPEDIDPIPERKKMYRKITESFKEGWERELT